MYETLKDQGVFAKQAEVKPIELGREFYLIHHFHAFREVPVSEYSTEMVTVLLGMFATVECAARTAVHGRFSEIEKSWVDDTKSDYTYSYGQCMQLAKCFPDSVFAAGNPSLSKTGVR